jgi:hypothetical protein
MMSHKSVAEVLDELEMLLDNYPRTMRATDQPYRLELVRQREAAYHYDPKDDLIRENLLEHVGSLPVVATTIYPYLDDPTVDLGQALVMLAVHDIGELVTGDEITFTKQAASVQDEQLAALGLLHPSYHDLYREVEAKSSPTAKFAKAVDKMTPDILDCLTPPEITVPRLRYFAKAGPDEIVGLLLKYKRPYMLWNPFMTELHKLICARLTERLRG